MSRFVAVGWGVPVAVDAAAGCDAALRARLPFWWWQTPVDDDGAAASARAPRTWTCAVPDQVPGVVADLELWVAEHAVGRVFVHAGVVGLPTGEALLLPGFSLTGKSTLVAALVAAGAPFASDEYAPLDGAGRVARYPRPVSRRDPVRREPVDPARWAPPELAVGAVAFIRYERATTTPVLRELPPGEAVLRLLEHTVPARARPAESLAAVAAAVEHARCVELVRGEAADAVSILRGLRIC